MSINYKQLEALVREAMFTGGGINEPSAPDGVPHRMPGAEPPDKEQDMGDDEANEKYDIALLKINADKIFEFVEFADSSKIQIGDFIIAVGNPFGLGGTVTTGIISALNRNINMSPYDNFIQIDAAINKGNSGGPTFNMEGKVIGVNTAIISPTGGNVGLGFSVPSNDVKRIISDIQKYGYVKRSWVGISLQELNAEMLQSLDIKDLLPRSVIITNIAPNSPAENYNLEIGDVIYQINNQKIYNINDLVKHIAKIKVNANMEFGTVKYYHEMIFENDPWEL